MRRTTSSRSDIGDEVRQRVDIRTGFLHMPRPSFLRRGHGTATEERRGFSRRPGREKSAEVGGFSRGPPSRNFCDDRRNACAGRTQACTPIRDGRQRSLDENARWNERFAARTHTATRLQVSTRRYQPRFCIRRRVVATRRGT